MKKPSVAKKEKSVRARRARQREALKKQRAIDGVIFDYFRQNIKNYKASNFHLHSHNGLSAYILKQPLCTFHLNYKSDIQM